MNVRMNTKKGSGVFCNMDDQQLLAMPSSRPELTQISLIQSVSSHLSKDTGQLAFAPFQEEGLWNATLRLFICTNTITDRDSAEMLTNECRVDKTGQGAVVVHNKKDKV